MRKRFERRDANTLRAIGSLALLVSACSTAPGGTTPTATATPGPYYALNLVPSFAVKAPEDVQIKAFDALTGLPLPLYSPAPAGYRVMSAQGVASDDASSSLSVKLTLPTQAPIVTGVVCGLTGGDTYVAFADTADAAVGKTYDQVAIDAASTALAQVAQPMLKLVGALDTSAATPLAAGVMNGLVAMRPAMVSYYQGHPVDMANLLAHVDPASGQISDTTIVGAAVSDAGLTNDVDATLRATIDGVAQNQSSVVRTVRLDGIKFPGSDLSIATGGPKLVLTGTDNQLTTILLTPSQSIASGTVTSGS